MLAGAAGVGSGSRWEEPERPRDSDAPIGWTDMAGDTFGKLFTVTTYGESHGPAMGGVVDGCPPGLALSLSARSPTR